jgi:DnaJ-class molecular chaperone
MKCPRCNGNNYVIKEQYFYSHTECSFCHGRGKVGILKWLFEFITR